MPNPHRLHSGFTLIELSIVLVIIGLIAGGILAGNDLLSAARVRAQIAQIDNYNAAVNTFRIKYGCLPGDCHNAATFGFNARGSAGGQGDGNGVIEGYYYFQPSNTPVGIAQGAGETILFWADLSMARLIPQSFSVASAFAPPAQGNVLLTSAPLTLKDFFPEAKLAKGNFVYVTGQGPNYAPTNICRDGKNYFSVSATIGIQGINGFLQSNPGIDNIQAYSMDSKIDDGLPQTGGVLAAYANAGGYSCLRWLYTDAGPNDPAATPALPNGCYDNGGINGRVRQYTLSVAGAMKQRCALSFRFQ